MLSSEVLQRMKSKNLNCRRSSKVDVANSIKHKPFRKTDMVDGSEMLRSPVEGKVVSPIIYKVFYIPGGWPWDF